MTTYTGLDLQSFTVTADFPINGITPGKIWRRNSSRSRKAYGS
jgi:hypothetical protein